MDAARTARRLGAADAVVVDRRARDRMPAHDIEVEEALEEGVTMRWLSTVTAAEEARRCMSCGNCFGCDNSYGACPDNAVIKLDAGHYEIDLDYCKGCGVCAAECPCGAIAMVTEET